MYLCAGPSDHEAWEEFVTRVRRPLRQIITRTAALWGKTSPSLVDDLIQSTYLKLWEGGRILLQEFASQYPEAILGYLMKTAANLAHDHFRRIRNQSSGGSQPHVSTADVEPEAHAEVYGGYDAITREIFLREIDELLQSCMTGPDQQRDRTIFWLYFRQGMTNQEIASLPGIGIGAKGVGSVIERLKRSLREQIVRTETCRESDGSVKAKDRQNP